MSTVNAVNPERSAVMRAVRQKDTRPELMVRRALHSLGYRFRLHRKGLPGRPDIVLPRHRVVILVHGCFWHRHPGCKNTRTPKSRHDFWDAKFTSNVARDERVVAELTELGWRVLTIWECEARRGEALKQTLAGWLDGAR
jgi:DNA mismatch endonuclease (patch repair protein)